MLPTYTATSNQKVLMSFVGLSTLLVCVYRANQPVFKGAHGDADSSTYTMCRPPSSPHGKSAAYTPRDTPDGAWEVATKSEPYNAPVCCGWDPGPGFYKDNPKVCGAEPMPRMRGCYNGKDLKGV